MTEKAKRPRLMVLLGAGASAHAKAPSTKEITDMVSRVNRPIVKRIVKDLTKNKKEGAFNFETVIAILEGLQEYLTPSWVRGGDSQWTLDHFTNIKCIYRKVTHVDIFRERFDLLRDIFSCFIDRMPENLDKSSMPIRRFIESLRSQFDLTILTLNYDDLIDHAGPWFDGFRPDLDRSDYSVFEPGRFVDRVRSEGNVLLHLHGSVRFGRVASGIVKYRTPQDAFDSLNGGARSPQWAAPIISGYQKERWLRLYAAPLGHYYRAFMDAAVTTPLWLIAGYGGNDQHVNTWVTESRRIHGERARVVVVNQGSGCVNRLFGYIRISPPLKPSDSLAS